LWPVEGEERERLSAEKRFVEVILALPRGVSHDAVSAEPVIGFLGFDQPSVVGLEKGSGVGSASDSEVSEGVGSESWAARVASFDVSSTWVAWD
jgi:hypothetical protein